MMDVPEDYAHTPKWCESCGKSTPAEYSGIHIESGNREYFCAMCAGVLIRDREIYRVRRLTSGWPVKPDTGKTEGETP